MSLKNKLESIKKEVVTEKDAEKIKEGKESVKEIESSKQVLVDRISGLKNLLSQLEGAYSSAGNKLDNFKEAKNKINDLFLEYKDYLKEKGINSVADILHNADFSDESEIQAYQESGTLKTDNEEERGKLGESVENLANIKKATKEALPDMDLDFRGKTSEGEDLSPRQASIAKIKNFINDLEKELAEVSAKESETKAEYLPKIRNLIKEKIDNIFKADNLSIAPKAANLNFISDEVFELCGEEFWPQVKNEAIEMIVEKDKTRFGSYNRDDIKKSLEAEKLIFDVENLRNNNKEVLQLEVDKINFSRLGYRIERELSFTPNNKILVKDGNIYPGVLMEQAQYFEEKNKDAKQVCEDVLEKLKALLSETKDKVPTVSFLTGKKKKIEIEKVKAELEEAEKELSAIEAPDNFHCNNKRYDFTNKLGSRIITPKFNSLNRTEWLAPLRKELDNGSDKIRQELRNLQSQEGPAVSKLSDALYNFGRRLKQFTDVNGFEIPFVKLAESDYYKRINSKEIADTFFKRLEGVNLDLEEFKKQVKEEEERISRLILDFPEAEKTLAEFNRLQEKYDSDFKYETKLMQTKLSSRKREKSWSMSEKGEYEIKQEMFFK